MKSTLKLLLLLVVTTLLTASASCSSKQDPVTPGGGGGLTCGAGQSMCNGMCIDTSSDSNNCGGCGLACGTGQHCAVSVCRCDGSFDICPGSTQCTSLAANHDNCGACGTVCGAAEVCDRGTCSAMCSVGLENCNGGCTNVQNDPFNCGACGNACGAGQQCSLGQCVCANGSPVCNGACTNVTADPNNCGGCGVACSVGQTCVGGTCQGGSVTTDASTTTTTGGTNMTSTGSTTTGTTTTTSTTGVGGGTSTTDTSSTTGGGDLPPGWWTYSPLDWHGCAWTGIDQVQGSTTTIVPQDFTAHTAGEPYCVQGTVHDDYAAVSLIGFNLGEDPNGADCSYDPADAMAEGPPGVTLGGTGIAINFTKSTAATLRVQIQGPDGATNENARWCATIDAVNGKTHVPYSAFNTTCWDGKGNAYNNEPISAIVFLVPGQDMGSFTDYDYCINGFATGNSAEDAPDGGDGPGTLMGDIGGPGSEDNDFQRVKVIGNDGHEYIIQNNNWGNPGGTDQTLTYTNNSFVIKSPTGGPPGGGAPASFPSIFIGQNGDVQDKAYRTLDSGLPKQVSAITSIPTTFKIGGSLNGQFNASYDVWFAASEPAPGSYDDGIDGFVMIWLYKPSNYNPIGWESGSKGTFSHSSGSFNVYVGGRDGGSARPVVSYIANSTITSMDFDLLDFIKDASKYGIQSSWFLTDVFGGFEIWEGGGTQGLTVQEFTAHVN